ncbi:phosphopantothenoylcysteine decarboxylase/phosphopantothenate--cysteine ligase [Prevotella sp. DNF00663]|uniref:bifunctional phosphopantothenoylcysteine decarboxylase/phosphopantothenate--cysteine ligase CoaBC n=1 Tax=Prevotella sp. DNF00663 TaxID=1384078 RepID=UPI0007866C5D|nr:bifunctional phosphopantothenoylcysteine decarboxylase/phosphopantothenate--cysteine ligase CoaBC [Prevotella sp. DNF00663]KXB83422.1 phosphopantothenoylcysteine decarboxylase/phosphopantothenate--cysteine ligase [Prevotella sp. DNF00663]
MLKGKHIVLGITGSIAAYKACSLIRLLIKAGAEVQVVITPAGKEFITPLTLSTLTRKPTISEFFSQRDGTWNSHVDLGLWADCMIIAPCTASTIGKMAHGVADNMLITTYLSMKAKIFVAPAMDLDMFAHPSTQQNLATLQGYGNTIIDPQSGFLASGLEGKGRMADPEIIVKAVEQYFQHQSTFKKKVLITAGPTFEKIDPVRFIGNYSSGKMGFAIAAECASRGADVTLIAGPVHLPTPKNVHRIDVESAGQMYEQTTKHFPESDVTILSAAVADFTFGEQNDSKIKRTGDNLELSLIPTKDIAASLGKAKKPEQLLVAFALETDHELENATKKLNKKNANFIVMNSTQIPGTTFQSDDNQITIIYRNGERKAFGKKSKKDVAKDIVDALEGYKENL